jgi:hypothetical protein
MVNKKTINEHKEDIFLIDNFFLNEVIIIINKLGISRVVASSE